jgi:hypothetical protein
LDLAGHFFLMQPIAALFLVNIQHRGAGGQAEAGYTDIPSSNMTTLPVIGVGRLVSTKNVLCAGSMLLCQRILVTWMISTNVNPGSCY